jgi:hypothetical protein
MSATDAMVSEVRLKLNEPDDSRFSDDQIKTEIEKYPVRDSDGVRPDDDDWVATYDLNRAISELWLVKANLFSEEFDFNADGASYQRSQKYEHAMKSATYYRSRSYAGSTLVLTDNADD